MCDTKFMQVLRICLMEKLFEFLALDDYCEESEHINRYCFMSYYHDSDLLQLMKCNKAIKTMAVERLIKKIYFFSSTLDNWRNPAKITRLVINEDLIISKKMLPEKLTHLKFDFYFNQPIDFNIIDSLPFLQHLEFGPAFNQPMHFFLNSSIKHLKIHNFHNGILKSNSLPSNLESLAINNAQFYNKNDLKIELGALPLTLKQLWIEKYNQPLDNSIFLPEMELEQLTVCDYDYPLNLSALRSLKEIIFKPSFPWWNNNYVPKCFNQQLTINSLPDSLTKLVLSDSWNHPLEPHVLPKNLTHLVFGKEFNQQIESSLSNLLLLEELEFGSGFNESIHPSSLPPNLKQLKLGNNNMYETGHKYDKIIKIGSLPKTLIKFIFNHNYKKNTIELGALPPGLECLEFGKDVEIGSFEVNFLPQSLHSFSIFSYYGTFAKGVLPKNLNRLKITLNFNQSFDQDLLPRNLHSLSLGENYNRPFYANALPPTLNHLELAW